MDFVGAAAGYIAKQLNLSKDRGCSCKSCREISNGDGSRGSNCSRNRLGQKRKLAKNADDTGKEMYDVFTSDPWLMNGLSDATSLFSSSQSLEDMIACENWGRNPGPSLSNLMVTDGAQNVEHSRHRVNLRMKHFHGREVKPLNSLESCLLAQLYNEQARTEEGPRSCFPSPSRPESAEKVATIFKLVDRTDFDSSQSRRGRYDLGLRDENAANSAVLPSKLIPGDNLKSAKPKGKRRTAMNSCSSKPNGHNLTKVLNGQNDDTFKFSVGMCVGLISSLVATRREIDRLNSMLKESQHLVQDLQEELEMKDSMTVKELNSESNGTSKNCVSNEDFEMYNQHKVVSRLCNETAEDSSLAMRKIEAELEAELERLGLNMSASKPHTTDSNYDMDEEYEPDFAQGELRVDTLSQSGSDTLSNGDSNGSSTPQFANYAVSPRELSLRLHEVIQSRLEDRVRQLEDALEASQTKVHYSPFKSEWKNVATKLTYSSEDEFPDTIEQPLVIDCSGDALDGCFAENDERTKTKESESDESPFDPCKLVYRSSSSEQFWCAGNSLADVILPDRVDMSVELGNTTYANIFDGDEDEDEMEKELIKQIVEKTKKGSPVVLNAQKLLFGMDEDYDYGN